MGERFGDYELIRRIATGGMAELFLARHATGGLDRVVVIKRMLPELAVRPDFVTMFLDEAKLTASLQHPHVVRVYDLGQVSGSYYIAMELVDGPHLGALFAHSLRARRPLPLELCAWIVARAADGLHYAHDVVDPATGRPLELVHRDISPQNILVGKSGEVKVTDFGVAKAVTQQTKTRTGVVKGKVSYMSPEQCLGDVVDRRTDVFALGIVLYELLTRRRLFRDKSDLLVMQRITAEDVAPPSTLNGSVNAELDAIALRALARVPAARYATAGAFAEAIDAWLADNRRPADELSMQTWFAAHCPELAPTHSTDMALITPSREALLLSSSAPTTLTPSYSQRDTEREVLLGEATAVSLPPPRVERTATSRPTERLLLVEPPNTQAEVDDGPSTPMPMPTQTKLEVVPSTPPKSARRPAVLVAAAVAVCVCLAGVVVLVPRLGEASTAASTTTSQAPIAAAMGTIDVVTVPAGATIMVDGRVAGVAPLAVAHAAGDVEVVAQFPEQPPQTATVTVASGKTATARFEARVPLVVRSSPSKAKVRVDGALVGETPFERGYLVAPGASFALRVEAPGSAAFEQNMVPVAGEPLVVDVTLVRERAGARPVPVTVDEGRGALSVRTEPWTLVQLDKETVGETPFAERPVKAGRHTLVVKNADLGLEDRFVVVVPKGATLAVILKYEKVGTTWKLTKKTLR